MDGRRRAIFTICSNNYVPMAKVLLASAARFHPEASLYLCLADQPLDETGFYPADCTLIPCETLGIADFRSFAFRYDVLEFNTALKPFMFRELLGRGHREAVYLDPDIELYAPLEQPFAMLEEGASFVLTPHLTAPAEGAVRPDDLAILRAGAYNLGFRGVGAGEEAERILHWWSRRVRYDCVSEQERGLFVDQRFMDLVPGFAAGARVLRDTAYNVAYWNLRQRTLAETDGGWSVDGEPLRFFHFSGIDPRDVSRLSRHTEAFQEPDMSPALRLLVRRYAERALAYGHRSVPAATYAYARFASGVPIPPVVRRMFRERHALWSGDPFETYEEYLRLPSPRYPAAAHVLTRLMDYLHEREPYLHTTYDLQSARGVQLYTEWFVRHARALGIDRRLVEPVAVRSGARRVRTPAKRVPRKRSVGEPDVSVIGYLRLALGVGEAGRQVLRTLRHAGLEARGIPIDFNSKSPRVASEGIEELLDSTASGPVQVFNVNADQMSSVIGHLGPALRDGAYRTIMPFWELEAFPDRWFAEFDAVDEVWAPTRYVQAMLSRYVPKPVLHMPLPLDVGAPAPCSRSALGLPDNAFLILFAFDFLSFAERKNPLALVRAFQRAFKRERERGEVALVLKTLNAEKKPERSRPLLDALRDEAGIYCVDRALDRTDMLGLVAACDAVASLHRSEGFGLLLAEALALGKPVVATDYSATTEFLTHQTGWPVDYRLVPVAAGDYPFHDGQLWAEPDEEHAAWQLRRMFHDRTEAARRAAAGRAFVERQFGMTACARRMRQRLAEIEAA